MKCCKNYTVAFSCILLCLILFFLHSCNQNNGDKQEKKLWHHKDVLPAKFKWFLNAQNYSDSNYKERFVKYYHDFLSQNQADSALYCLLVYGEMVDQNYLYDSFYLETAIKHLEKFEPVSTESGELIKLYYYIGSQYESNSENILAEEWFKKGINHPNILLKTKIKCLGMLAQVYQNINQPEKALPLQLERLTYYEKEKDTINIGVIYSSISNIYDFLNAHQIATENMLKAIECARIKHDTNTLIPYLANYFIKLKSEDDNFKFTENQKKDLQEFNAICDAYSKQSPYNELIRSELNFSFFLKENKTDSLKIILDKMDKLKVLLNNPTINNELAFIHLRYNFKIGNPIKNENKIIEIAESFEKNEMWWEAWRIYKILYSTAKSKGDFKSALNYFEKFYVIEIQIQNMNNKGQIYEMDVKYQTEKKDQEIALQAEKLKIKQQNIGLLLSGLLIVTLSFFAYFIWQKKKIITEKRKNETLFTQKLMENTEEERMRIAKDLHDSVGHELLSIKNSIINKLQFTEEKIDHVLNEVREISRNLFPVMFEEVGLKISIDQLAENIKQTDNFYVGTEINYIAGTLSVKWELQVYRIIQEALTNTRKYANAESAMVSIFQEKNEILVAIKDNGKGFDVMDVLKSGKAFGLLAINQRCNALNTQANIVSDKNGTSISFQIPIKHV